MLRRPLYPASQHGKTAETPEPFKLRYLPLFWGDLNDAVSYIANTLGNMAAAERATCFPVCS